MKTLYVCVMLAALNCTAQLRQVDDRIYNIKPLVDWVETCKNDPNWRTTASYPPNPMPGWEAIPSYPEPGMALTATVYQVLRGEGVVIQTKAFNAFTFSGSAGGSLEFIKNYPAGPSLVDGDTVKCFAKKIGSFEYGGQTIPAFDCGTAPVQQTYASAPVLKLTEEELATAKAAADKKRADDKAKELKADQDGANAGNVAAEYRLGKRYQYGDGVPKDLDKAKMWFTSASVGGNKDAALELKDLAGK